LAIASSSTVSLPLMDGWIWRAPTTTHFQCKYPQPASPRRIDGDGMRGVERGLGQDAGAPPLANPIACGRAICCERDRGWNRASILLMKCKRWLRARSHYTLFAQYLRELFQCSRPHQFLSLLDIVLWLRGQQNFYFLLAQNHTLKLFLWFFLDFSANSLKDSNYLKKKCS